MILSNPLKDFITYSKDNCLISNEFYNLVWGSKYRTFDYKYLSESPGGISYLTTERLNRQMEEGGSPWESRFRQVLKPGSLINKLFPGEFTPTETEKFVNYYNSYFSDTRKLIFKEVMGESIREFYKMENSIPSGGSLSYSCMATNAAQKFLDLYVMNPQRVKMLCLIDENCGLLAGRALLWKLDSGETLLDKIYGFNDTLVQEMFIKYSIERGFIYKEKQKYDGIHYIVNGVRVSHTLSVTLENYDFEYYPFLDSMKYLNPETGVLTNFGDNLSDAKLLVSDGGRYYFSNEMKVDPLNENLNWTSGMRYVEKWGFWTRRDLVDWGGNLISDNLSDRQRGILSEISEQTVI